MMKTDRTHAADPGAPGAPRTALCHQSSTSLRHTVLCCLQSPDETSMAASVLNLRAHPLQSKLPCLALHCCLRPRSCSVNVLENAADALSKETMPEAVGCIGACTRASQRMLVQSGIADGICSLGRALHQRPSAIPHRHRQKACPTRARAYLAAAICIRCGDCAQC